jgi:hypothetical protein
MRSLPAPSVKRRQAWKFEIAKSKKVGEARIEHARLFRALVLQTSPLPLTDYSPIINMYRSVEVAGFEPACNQLPFLHCIRVRRYTSIIFCSGNRIRTLYFLIQNQASCR